MSTVDQQPPSSWSIWSIIVPLLPLALALIANILGRARDQQLIQAGIDQEIAAQSKAIFERTEAGKKMMGKIEGMHDPELDQLIKDLGQP